MRHLLTLELILLASLLSAAEPQILDDRLSLQLVAEQPDIVTPIGITFDSQGRLLVVECNTHFPPEGYTGAKSDRVRIVLDKDRDGDADEMTTYYEGTRATMSMRSGPENWIYIATRREVFRIRDSDGDDVADEREGLIRLETRGDYPHNGLGGLAFDTSGQLYFGLGENLGEPYAVIGSDGSRSVGGGEGGNVYRCTAKGENVERIATGFWNPFGLCVDPANRIFEVCNDPDASPPCRLIHVVPSGDYGYQFRFGRAGRHPLQAWNGELPGTLPMVAGTGEAPCSVIPYHGQLWVSSWGDYRIERFQLRPRGASFVAASETVVQGDENFRPVDFAIAPDGSLYFTDWVDQSYPVHGKGRIWRLSWKDSGAAAPPSDWPMPNEAEERANSLRQHADLAAFDSTDVFEHQAAMHGLLAEDQLEFNWAEIKTAAQRLGILEAARWQALEGAPPRKDWIEAALKDSDSQVRLFALRWVAEANLKEFRTLVEEQLKAPAITPGLFQATLATLEWLDTGKVAPLGDNPSYEHYLVSFLKDPQRPNVLRALSLRLLDPDHKELDGLLETFVHSGDEQLQLEAVRSMVLRQGAGRSDALLKIASDVRLPVRVRADAVAGLAPVANVVDSKLEAVAKQHKLLAREVERLRPSKDVGTEKRPPTTDVDAWIVRVGSGGDSEAGWRVFFASEAKCGACHRYGGRGSDVGPDLTLAGQRREMARLVDSILNPDQEIAPQFVPWNIETEDGRVLIGLSLGSTTDGRGERFLAADGTTFEIDADQIAARQAAKTSIMPGGIHQSLTDAQLRDLIAFLTSSSAD